MTPEQARAALEAIEAKRAAGTPITHEDVATAMEAADVVRHAEAEARRAATTPHVRKPPKKKIPPMSGPRYFNLMRAMDRDVDGLYADYQETTYCGAEISTEDLDRRTALARKNETRVVEWGVCKDCLRIAREESNR